MVGVSLIHGVFLCLVLGREQLQTGGKRQALWFTVFRAYHGTINQPLMGSWKPKSVWEGMVDVLKHVGKNNQSIVFFYR